jgi:hypothetical protein
MRISPVVIVKVNGKRTMLSKYFQGAPSLIEFGKDMVGNMSIEDGTTYNMKQTMSIGKKNGIDTYTTINYTGNPCTYEGKDTNGQPTPQKDSYPFKNYFLPGTNANNLFGCLVDGSNGTFQEGKTEESNPYYHVTGWLDNPSKKWCDNVQIGQCSRDDKNSSLGCQAYAPIGGGPANFTAETCTGCFENGEHTKFTTYCYSYDDLSSSPSFSSPYKMQVFFKNLNDNAHPEELTIPDCKGTPYDGKCGDPDVYCLSKKNKAPDCPKFLNSGNLDIINVCYQNGRPPGPPGPTGPTGPIQTCKSYNLTPPCQLDFYACYNDTIVYCNPEADIFNNPGYTCNPLCYNGDGPTGTTGPTGPTGTTGGTCEPTQYQGDCNSQCATNAYVCINGDQSAQWGCYANPITCDNYPNAKCESTCRQGPRN